MKKKVAFQLGVIVVAAIALVLLSIPFFKEAGNSKRPRASHAVAELSPKPGSGKPVR